MTLQKFHNDRQFKILSNEKKDPFKKLLQSKKMAGTEIWLDSAVDKYWLLDTTTMSQEGPYFNSKNAAIRYAIDEGKWNEDDGESVMSEMERLGPDGVGSPGQVVSREQLQKTQKHFRQDETKSASEAYRQNKTSTVIDALKGKKSIIQKQESIVPELKTIASTNYSDQYKGKDDRFVRAYHHVKYVLDLLVKKAVGAPPSETKPSKFEFETREKRPSKDWKPDEYSVATGKIEEVISNAQGCVEKMEIIDESVKVYKDSIKEIKKAVNAKEKELKASGKYTEIQEEVTSLAEEIGNLTTGNVEAKEQAIRWNDRMLRIQTKIKEMPSAPSPQQKLDFIMSKLEALGSEGKKVKKALYDYERDNTTITKQIVTSIQSIAISKVFEKELEGVPVTESIKVAGFMDVVNKVKGLFGSIWDSLKSFTSSLSSANAVADEILEGLE